ncbi:TetR/AcrR family transcriptional regulator [Frankia sp. Mgl5]|uniref:TetR/AcrR family transcriptional regulator n=1 Tax=Frankia sp. Mgl5 TaxID=2933793 RepID=UPI00200DB7D4|nr:TetR/AcrR family transcriptional regulator [Frankia sp. Mgl5]
MSWAERAADRSPSVQRSRSRSMRQMKVIVAAAKRLIAQKGTSFTTQELVKEAGVAMQTFYRHFEGKDQLLMAVIEEMVTDQAVRYEQDARDLPDPVARLRRHILSVLGSLDASGDESTGPRFITAEHWRLHQLYPEEMAQATQPFADLVAREIRAARDAGLLAPQDVERDAALVARLVMSVYHHYAFAAAPEPAEVIADHLWAFCLAGLGGDSGGGRPARPVRRPPSS